MLCDHSAVESVCKVTEQIRTVREKLLEGVFKAGGLSWHKKVEWVSQADSRICKGWGGTSTGWPH